MNRPALLTLVTLCLSSTLSHGAFDWFGGRLSIGGGYGRTKPKLPYAFQDSHQNGQVWTAHMKYFLNDRLSLVASYADLVAEERGAVRKARFRPVVGSVRVNLFRGLPITPYLTAGAGASMNMKEAAGAANTEWTRMTAQGGVGLEFFVNQGTSFGAEALYHHFVAERRGRDYGVASLVGTVNVYFGAGPATKQAREEMETARAAANQLAFEARAQAEQAARAKADADSAMAKASASEQAAKDAEEKALAMQARAHQAQRELDEIKAMVQRKDISPVNFATGSATLLAMSHPTLNRVAEIGKKYPELQMQVEGHTDSQGSDAKNLRLSQDRADSVRNYLIEQGVVAQQIKAVGFGESRPIAPNETPEGRLQNRRVEFLFTLN